MQTGQKEVELQNYRVDKFREIDIDKGKQREVLLCYVN